MKEKRAEKLRLLLERLFPDPRIPLDHKDPFTLLVAVLLSAQCTDARVNQVTPALFSRADTPEKMASIPQEELEELIRPCGFFRVKARALISLSQDLLARHRGQVPGTFEELEALPGVGHKTASVILSAVFHMPAFPVDTHIHRCAKRWGLSSGASVEKTEEDLKKLFPPASWGKLHLQMILAARKYCPARPHSAEACSICSAIL